ncbi:hypothetical protein TSTA_109650 [Talaromyces stipitatus ATCC 10500]|uniref:Uncharacterized protein n=1 Tax=Talaromyces stipitatus (strain ATCC 10500 / CBS 375.48 / QM 6759 / NRRL 1006) TaxID=441959 RepID=B8MUE6_TALSN|nr:uncharacterized protein TSTA_109650 [Talaromyces stipitatus ATCC 10500]EED11785.1 hypothetical protein TSTA_109650 [Talaromyces stipitatus ATCC 10500]
MAPTICSPWPAEDPEQFPGSLHVPGINEPYNNDNFDRYWSAMDTSDPDFPLQRAIGQDLRPTSPSSGFSASVSLAGTDDKSRIEELINCVTDMREELLKMKMLMEMIHNSLLNHIMPGGINPIAHYAKHYRDLKKSKRFGTEIPLPDPSLMGTTRGTYSYRRRDSKVHP